MNTDVLIVLLLFITPAASSAVCEPFLKEAFDLDTDSTSALVAAATAPNANEFWRARRVLQRTGTSFVEAIVDFDPHSVSDRVTIYYSMSCTSTDVGATWSCDDSKTSRLADIRPHGHAEHGCSMAMEHVQVAETLDEATILEIVDGLETGKFAVAEYPCSQRGCKIRAIAGNQEALYVRWGGPCGPAIVATLAKQSDPSSSWRVVACAGIH